MAKRKKVKPLMKYAGNKYGEYKSFKNYLPEKINNYYEPFAGAAGTFIQLKNDDRIQGKSYINDISDELIMFYNMIGKKEFTNALEEISEAWEILKEISKNNARQFKEDVTVCIKDDIVYLFNEDLVEYLKDTVADNKAFEFMTNRGVNLSDYIYKSFKDKTKRLHNKYNKNPENIDFSLIPSAIETSYSQAFYFAIRHMYNSWRAHGDESYTDYEKIAQWYYLRDFCFGGMFRYNAKGEFNIPYGGKSYNTKCFDCKIDMLKDPDVIKLFTENVKYTALDYKDALNVKFDKDDFVFLDPPYDTTFSDYNNHKFDIDCQFELRSFLKKLPCKWMLVVQGTDFMRKCYKEFLDDNAEYEKEYSYRARGNYNSNVKHIVIKNF